MNSDQNSTSPEIDAEFTDAEYKHMLEEVRTHLPLFLSAAATEHANPGGGLDALTGLEPADLTRVVSVHLCLSQEARAFAHGLESGLRRPLTATDRPELITQAVNGPIDWAGTVRRRSLTGWDPSVFVVRPGQRIFDTPENRALAWVLRQLRVALSRALRFAEADESVGWPARLADLQSAVDRTRRVEWLRDIQPERPTPRVLQRLAAARLSFYREDVGRLIHLLLQSESLDAERLAEVLCERYFRPDKAWRLFEVLVALRLSHEFADPKHPTTLKKARLLAGGDRVRAYASYSLPDGEVVELLYQRWPAEKAPSKRQEASLRHHLKASPSKPDLMVTRRNSDGEALDVLVIELKASTKRGTLADGLSQLLGYLAERPSLFGEQPAGWLVAPKSDAFIEAPPVAGEPLWLTTADGVAAAASGRMMA